MRRADRLFQIVQYLRGGRLTTAAQLAERLEVSERTIYRDIVDLQASGVPVDGEAGVGYLMREGFDLPPLMFTREEVAALVAGARMVRAWGGAAMARGAAEALVKIETVLPEASRARARDTKIFAPPMNMTDELRARFDEIEAAIDAHQALGLSYRDEAGEQTRREIQPLGLWFWGKVWTLVAWCELREDFRTFRLDRIASLSLTGRKFKPSPERSLSVFLARMDTDCRPQQNVEAARGPAK